MTDPIQCHRVDGGISTLERPGDFFWTYTKDDDWGDKPITSERVPVRFWYMNPYKRIGSITIKPNIQENGAGWDWDKNLDVPTISPSINENGPGDEGRNWHGFIKAGIMTTV